jgi:site-specific DNA-adenine methylase
MYVRDLTLQQPFRYSGSKTKLLSKCDFYFPDDLLVVEPFMGAANFAVSTGLKWYGYESNQELVNMVEWLQTVSPQGLQRLRDDYEG